METQSEYETKIVCDAPCHLCKHTREKDIIDHSQNVLYYCRSCQEKYLCNEVLGRSKGEAGYICPKCSGSIIEMTIERAQQLGLAFGIQITRVQKAKRPVEEIKQTWFYSSGDFRSKEAVHELIKYENLGVSHIIDLLYHSDLVYRPEQNIIDKKRLLWDIFSRKPAIIRSLHNSLITKSEHRRVDLIARALINHEKFKCTYLSSIIPSNIAGTVDLIGVDDETGKIVWFIVQEDKIDETLINSILNEVLSIPPLEFMGVERIVLLTKKWVWMAAEITRRQGRIHTRWKQLNIELWEEDALYNFRML